MPSSKDLLRILGSVLIIIQELLQRSTIKLPLTFSGNYMRTVNLLKKLPSSFMMRRPNNSLPIVL